MSPGQAAPAPAAVLVLPGLPCGQRCCPRHAAHRSAAASQRSFKNFSSREPMHRMHTQEVKAELSLDRLQLESLHKVRGLC